MRVYTIAAGIGRRKENGEWQALDTTQVRELAEGTGGSFFSARNADAVTKVYATIDALEKEVFEEPRYELRDRFLPFLLGGLVLLLLSGFLRAAGLRVLP